MRVRAAGAMALAVTPMRPSSADCTSVRLAIAPLAAEYAAWATEPMMPAPDEVLMIRPATGSPAFDRDRQYCAAWRAGAAWPSTWTRSVASHSSCSEFTNIRSRRIPALQTTVSRPPKVSTATPMSSSADFQSATSWLDVTASPPLATISSTTCCAGVSDGSEPSEATPRSFTTTLAPWRANSSACSRPIPRPAPVTMTTRPSQMPMSVLSGPARRQE